MPFERTDRSGEVPIRFDLFALDAKRGELRRSGLPLDLPPQALRVLVMLAERPDELVTRKEIQEALWPGQSYGDFDGRLNFAIKKLREALGDDAEQPRYVQTVRSAGYRFIAPLREPRAFSDAVPGAVDHTTPRERFQLGSRLFMSIVTAIVAVAVVGLFTLRQHRSGQAAVPEVQAAVGVTKAEPGPRILSVSAVIPEAKQRVVIKGTGFGLHVPYARTDSPYLAIRDLTANWSAGRMIPQNTDEVMLDVESWMDTEIVVSGFSGDYDRKGWRLAAGDELEIAIWNPQSGVGPALYHTKVMAGNGVR